MKGKFTFLLAVSFVIVLVLIFGRSSISKQSMAQTSSLPRIGYGVIFYPSSTGFLDYTYESIMWGGSEWAENLMEQNPSALQYEYTSHVTICGPGNPAFDPNKGFDDPNSKNLTIGHYNWIREYHPDWFLKGKDQNGNLIDLSWNTNEGYYKDLPNFIMDFGNKGYQDFWAETVIKGLQNKQREGVAADEFPALYNYQTPFMNGTLETYKSPDEFESAARSFLRNVIPKLKTAGFKYLPNIGAAMFRSSFNSWSDNSLYENEIKDGFFPNGYMIESAFHAGKYYDGDLDGREDYWNVTDYIKNLKLVALAELAPTEEARIIFGGSGGSAVQKNSSTSERKVPVWSLVSYLLAQGKDTRLFFSYLNGSEFGQDSRQFIPEVSFANFLGKPVGNYYHPNGNIAIIGGEGKYTAENVFKRDFENGTIILSNTYEDTKTDVTFEVALDKEYYTIDGEKVNKVSLWKHSAIILVANPPAPEFHFSGVFPTVDQNNAPTNIAGRLEIIDENNNQLLFITSLDFRRYFIRNLWLNETDPRQKENVYSYTAKLNLPKTLVGKRVKLGIIVPGHFNLAYPNWLINYGLNSPLVIKSKWGNTYWFKEDPSVAYTPVNQVGDANGDGRVDSEDFALLVQDYLGEPVHNTDFNSDNRVDSEDFAILQSNYLKEGEK